MALSRLKSLSVSLDKRNLRNCYDQEINLLLSKGYAEVVPPLEVLSPNTQRVWYLPHQAVVSDKKPGKTRIVFDCAAKCGGVSLNSSCLQGPDLNNRLLSVMLRFREHPYAVMADIESMYHQVLMPFKDRDALRFLWYNDLNEVCHFRMTRHLFGGVWCSSSSTYALRKILEEHDEIDPVVSDTILRSFYVDDCLRSVLSREEAEVVIHGTKSVLADAGFNLTKFVTNDEKLLDGIPEAERAKEVKDFSSDCKSKVLGVKWNVKSDVLYFDVSASSNSLVTRRHMLSFVSSNFDPLGLVSPVVIIGKLLFQEATRLKLPWDEEVPESLRLKWEIWLRNLRLLTEFEVLRCFRPFGFGDSFSEIHHFSDSSEKGGGIWTSFFLWFSAVLGFRVCSCMSLAARVAPSSARWIPSRIRISFIFSLLNQVSLICFPDLLICLLKVSAFLDPLGSLWGSIGGISIVLIAVFVLLAMSIISWLYFLASSSGLSPHLMLLVPIIITIWSSVLISSIVVWCLVIFSRSSIVL